MQTQRNPMILAGATGTVGTHLMWKLLEHNIKFRAMFHSIHKAQKLQRKNIESYQVEFLEPETLKHAFEGVEKLFLLTPDHNQMVEMTHNLVEAARQAGVSHIVKLSAVLTSKTEVDGDCIAIERQHLEAEQLVIDSKIGYTFLRSSDFMQNFINFYINDIKSRNIMALPLGEGREGFVDVRDIATVAHSVLLKPGHVGKTYRLTGPESLSGYQITEILSSITGRNIIYEDIPEAEKRQEMENLEMPEWMIHAFMELYAFVKAGKLDAVTSTIEEITGAKPTTFEQFVKDHIDVFR